MNSYEDILIEADSHVLITREKPLQAHKGRIKGNRIAVNNKLTEKEKNVFWPKSWVTTILQEHEIYWIDHL